MNLFKISIAITIFSYFFQPSQIGVYMNDSKNLLPSSIPNHSLSSGCPDNFTIKLGESFSLKLPATEGTGYLWIPNKSSLLSWNEGEEYEKDLNNTKEPKMVGSAVKQILIGKAIKSGKDLITIHYMRPFGSKKPEKSCQFNLNVID